MDPVKIAVLLALAIALAEAQNVYVATPNSIRLGVEEKIALAVDETAELQRFTIYVQDYPGKRKNVSTTISTVMPEEPKTVSITIEPSDVEGLITLDGSARNLFSLTVHSDNFRREVILPLSFKTGHVFIQTDKPIYTPKDSVKFRIIPLNEEAKPSSEKVKLLIKNPNGLVVLQNEYSGKIFITPEPYNFPSYPLLGTWSATVLYGYQMKQNATVQFDLKEYVLPTFTVKITTPDIILPSAEKISFSVEAKHVYGKPVSGAVLFRLGVKGEAPEVTYFASVEPNQLADGTYNAIIGTEDFKFHPNVGWFPEIEGSQFVVEATVIDDATGQKEIATDATAYFSTTPFRISFKRCLSDFKPGLISIIEADVSYISGKPASGIKTEISAVADGNVNLKITDSVSISNEDGKVLFEIHPEIQHSSIKVTVSTTDPKYVNNQAVGHHIQNKFKSDNKAYIAITRRTREKPKPEQMFTEVIHIEPTSISNIYYMVVSRGIIRYIKKLPKGNYRTQRVEFKVTQEMVPSFRLVVFAEYQNELVADSLYIDVADVCDPNADVKIKPDEDTKEPGSTVRIGIEGSKSAVVGLLAVDTAVYALSKKDRLTKAKMFKTLESHDTGCGPGGGLTTKDVLRNAGVVISTRNFAGEAMVSACEENLRRKRELIRMRLDRYRGYMRECCALGLSHDLYNRNCIDRAEIVRMHLQDRDANCSGVFLECCLHGREKDVSGLKLPRKCTVWKQRSRMGAHFDELSFVSTEEEEKQEGDVGTRIDFRDTWIFDDIVIGPDGKADFQVTLPDSITTWVIQAVVASQNYGMCIAVPQNLKSFKNVFLQLNLPYSVVRNEQIEIRATVFNYGDNDLSVIVYMYGVENLCTGVHEREKSERKKLKIPGHSAATAAFPVIPLKEGTYDIKVVALSFGGSDSVIRKLNVVPEGETVVNDITVPLDPSNQQRRTERDVITDAYSDSIDNSQNLQVTTVKLKVPDDVVPGTESCTITALGDAFGPTVQTSLQNPEKLIDKPRGCAEQAMIYLAPTLYTMRYLKAVDKITPEMETNGYEFIRQGYDLILTYRKDDGSFGAWITTPSSTWLTAFITKVFCQAKKLVYIDEEVMCSGVRWLVAGLQGDGSFIELNPVYHKEMMGGVKGKAPLTAFVLITLAECSCDIPDMDIIKARAVAYLEENLGDVNEPLAVAISAYALALTNSELKNTVNDKLLALSKYDPASNMLFWETHSSAFDIEAASYGLLTQLLLLKMDKSNSIVNWLNTKRMASGSFQSTQDTVMGLQALSEYAIRAKSPGLNLVSNITSNTDITLMKTFHFDEKNALIVQSHQINKLGGTLFVNTAGHGVGFLNVKLRYNVHKPPEKLRKFEVIVNVTEDKIDLIPPPQDHRRPDSDILPEDLIRAADRVLILPPEAVQPKFDIDPRNRRPNFPYPFNEERFRFKREDNVDNSNVVFRVNICVRYLGNNLTGMSIVDAGIFSGFTANEDDLKRLVNSPNNLIDKYEKSNRSVVLYIREIPKDEPHCFSFRVIRNYIVGDTRSAIVTVYSYYKPEMSASIFYSPDHNSPLLRKICSGGICQCAEGGCPLKQPFSRFGGDRNKLKHSACEEHDYAWIVVPLEPVRRKDGFLHIKARVHEVLKEGIEKGVENAVRQFLARDNCEVAELYPNKKYLILGKDGAKYENEEGKLWHRYLLDKMSIVYEWNDVPTGPKKNIIRTLLWLRLELKEGCDL